MIQHLSILPTNHTTTSLSQQLSVFQVTKKKIKKEILTPVKKIIS